MKIAWVSCHVLSDCRPSPASPRSATPTNRFAQTGMGRIGATRVASLAMSTRSSMSIEELLHRRRQALRLAWLWMGNVGVDLLPDGQGDIGHGAIDYGIGEQHHRSAAGMSAYRLIEHFQEGGGLGADLLRRHTGARLVLHIFAHKIGQLDLDEMRSALLQP